MATYERRRTHDLIEKQRSNEYVALRAELLSLHERAHAVWRWGLTAIVALLGVVVTVLAGIDNDASLKSFLCTYPHIIALVLDLFAAIIAITLANLSANIRYAMNRLGAYLAFFHDQPVVSVPPFAYSLGWHIWNRIDRINRPQLPTSWSAALRSTLCKISRKGQPEENKIKSSTEHHGEPIVYVVVMVFFVLFVGGLVNAIANVSLWDFFSLVLVFVTVTVVLFCLYIDIPMRHYCGRVVGPSCAMMKTQ